MSEKKDQLKEILKDQLNREAKQIEEQMRMRNSQKKTGKHFALDGRC